jgi:hypothetical protein
MYNCEDEMIASGIYTGGNRDPANPDYWKRAIKQTEQTQIVGDDIPPVEGSSISGAERALG